MSLFRTGLEDISCKRHQRTAKSGSLISFGDLLLIQDSHSLHCSSGYENDLASRLAQKLPREVQKAIGISLYKEAMKLIGKNAMV